MQRGNCCGFHADMKLLCSQIKVQKVGTIKELSRFQLMAESLLPLDVNAGDELPNACQSLKAISHGLGEIKSKLIKAVNARLIPFDGDPRDKRLRSPDHLQQP